MPQLTTQKPFIPPGRQGNAAHAAARLLADLDAIRRIERRLQPVEGRSRFADIRSRAALPVSGLVQRTTARS